MTCNACGEKPKNTAKDFTKAVIEINNPETLVLLRKVVVPASMGTEEQVPAAIGKYHNVILRYEANRHVYLYSSDGIPTLLEMDVPQEVWDSIDELQDEIDEIKNNPDVVDIVDTYADLQAYDTSDLGDKDVIRVLTDETHDNESSYYRWSTTTQTWTFIGATGPYYTKDETDAIVDAAKGKAKTLSSADYNWNSVSHDTTEPYDSVALWLLDPGCYTVPDGLNAYVYNSTYTATTKTTYIVGAGSTWGVPVVMLRGMNHTTIGWECGLFYLVNKVTGGKNYEYAIGSVIDGLNGYAYTTRPLSANQGYVLNNMIGDLSTLTTTNKSSTVAAINEVMAGLTPVVQTTGTSTTSVMSQKAVTDNIPLVFTTNEWNALWT